MKTCDQLMGNPKIQDLIGYVICIIQAYIVPLIFVIAMAVFFWGIVQFVILGASQEGKREQGRQLMIWGIIAFVVMLGVWSLVKIVGSTFGLETSFLPQVKP